MSTIEYKIILQIYLKLERKVACYILTPALLSINAMVKGPGADRRVEGYCKRQLKNNGKTYKKSAANELHTHHSV
jgi:hypothetical protein